MRGTHPDLAGHLATWCRQHGHRWRATDPDTHAGVVGVIERGSAVSARWVGAQRAGHADPSRAGALAADPPADWGLAARGAAVEPGGPTPQFRLHLRDEVWTERATALYAQAAAAQWDPATAIDWAAPIEHSRRVEAAVVQVMTFLIENEQAALVVPARFLGQVHPHFREIQQFLAVTVADEARHIEVFTRRATMTGHDLALSSVGGRASLQTLLDEPDYAIASFLLSVMGEGTFVSLLSFLERHAPDPITRRIAHLTRTDEARHVAFSLAHLERHARLEPDLRGRLARAVEQRHRALQQHLRPQRRRLRRPRPARRRRRHPRPHPRRMAPRPRAPSRDERRPPSTPRPPRIHHRRSRSPLVAPHPQLHVTSAHDT